MQKSYLLIFISIGFLIASCGPNSDKKADPEKKEFSVRGVIPDSPGKKIRLDMIGGGSTLTIDSAVIDPSGKFELEGTTTGPDLFILKHENGQFSYLLVEPGEEMEITAKASGFALSFGVDGSPGTRLLADLNRRHFQVLQQMDSMSQIYRQNEKSPQIDQILADLTKKSEVIFEGHRRFLRDFIQKNTKSLASILALYQPIGQGRFLMPDRDMDVFKLADSVLTQEHPKSVHVQNFHSDFLNMTTQLNQGKGGDPPAGNSPGIGMVAPDISLPDPYGEVRSLASLRGKYVLLDFWASWCRPCREENPAVKKAYDKFSKKGFEVFQVSLDKNKDAWMQGISKDNLYWKNHVSDLKYWESEPAKLYGVTAIPANFLLDRDGKILAVNLRGPALEAKLAELLK